MKTIIIFLLLTISVFAQDPIGSSSIKKTQETLWQDPTNDLFVWYFLNTETVPPTTLSANASIGDSIVTVTSATGLTAGDFIGIFSTAGRLYFAEIRAIVSTTCTLDVPLDYAFQSGDTFIDLTKDMDVDGSATTQYFSIQSSSAGVELTLDITKIIISMTTTGVPDFAKFGDIAGGLNRGLLFRIVRANGEVYNLFNFKTNGEMANVASKYDPNDASKFGVEGLTVEIKFSGISEMGSVIRLSAGDKLQALAQDNLTSILTLNIRAIGHLAEID